MVARLKLKDIDGRAPPGDDVSSTPGQTLPARCNPPAARGGKASDVRGPSGVPAAGRSFAGRIGPQIRWRPAGSSQHVCRPVVGMIGPELAEPWTMRVEPAA